MTPDDIWKLIGSGLLGGFFTFLVLIWLTIRDQAREQESLDARMARFRNTNKREGGPWV